MYLCCEYVHMYYYVVFLIKKFKRCLFRDLEIWKSLLTEINLFSYDIWYILSVIYTGQMHILLFIFSQANQIYITLYLGVPLVQLVISYTAFYNLARNLFVILQTLNFKLEIYKLLYSQKFYANKPHFPYFRWSRGYNKVSVLYISVKKNHQKQFYRIHRAILLL